LTPGVATQFFETPPQIAIVDTDEPQDITGHNAEKPTPSVATPVIATPPQDAKFTAGEPLYSTGNDDGKTTKIVATPSQDTTFRVDGPRKQ
jgi:hypothetical protein